MHPAIEPFLARHLAAQSLGPAYDQIERWAQAGDVGLLVELLAALEQPQATAGAQPWAREALADRVERTLALTPGQAQAEATIAVAQIPRVASAQRPRDAQSRHRQLAQCLASAQPPAVLFRLFEHPAAQAHAPELLAALLQELVVRGHEGDEPPAALAWAAHLAASHHPLAWLPLRLAPAERSLAGYLPRHSPLGSSSTLLPSGLSPSGGPHPPAPRVLAVDITQPAEHVRLEAAVAHWRDASNGRIEARVFAIDPPLAPAAVSPAALLRLGLDCLAGSGADAIGLAPRSVADALTALFIAAATGGAYVGGVGGGNARLYAWQSLGALAGIGPEAAFEATVQAAGTCRWWAFDAPGWFEHVAWDLGLVALRPAGDSLAVLAATDTD